MIPGKFCAYGNEYDISAVEEGGYEGRKPSKSKIASMGHHYDYKCKSRPFPISVSLEPKSQYAPYAYKEILKHAGASKKRDAVDKRIIKEVKKGKATFRGSVTGLPGIIDSENDVR